MKAFGSYLLAPSIEQGFQNNLLEASELNLSNWLHDENVSNEFANSVNHVTVTVAGEANAMYDQLLQWNKIDSTILSLQEFKVLYNRANTEYGDGNWNLYATYATRYGYSHDYISIGAVPNTVDMVYGENGYNQGTFNGCGNDWRPLGSPRSNYECVSIASRMLNGTWSVWMNKDDTYIGSDNYFQGYGFGWDKYAIYNDTKIVAPNGYRYNYKNSINIATGGGLYNYYTDDVIFVCDDAKTANGNYHLLTLLKNVDNVNTIVQVDTSQGSYTSSSTRVYPSSGTFGGYNKVPAVSYGQNESTCQYNWSTNLTAQEVEDQNITKYSTMEEAYNNFAPQTQQQSESLSGSSTTLPSIGEYLTLTKQVVSGKKYWFCFDGCTTSGFEYESGATCHDITLESGNNSAYVKWNNESSENQSPYEVDVTADGDSLVITFHFDEFENDQHITFDISQMGLYEVV